MKKKNIILISGVILVLLLAAVFFKFYNFEIKRLEKLAADKPELSVYTKDVIKALEDVHNEPEKIENYTILGLSWKSLAENVENKDYYYEKALGAYITGIDKTQRKNTLFMINAGNMCIYLKRYEQAEDFYKEALSISPGDASLYFKLADLYHYQMGKTVDEVAAVFDSGMEKILNPGSLILRKISYYKEIGEYKKALDEYNKLIEKEPALKEKYRASIEELETEIKKN